MISFNRLFSNPVKYVRSGLSDIVAAFRGRRYGYDSPYELNTEEDGDAMFHDHYGCAGSIDLWAHLDPHVRRDAEEKSDLERRNNGPIAGSSKAYANDVIGKEGPTLQVIDNEHYEWTEETREEYQNKYHHFARKVMKLHRKAKNMLKSELIRGEGVGFFVSIEREEFTTARGDKRLSSEDIHPNPLGIDFVVRDARRMDDDVTSSANRLSRISRADGENSRRRADKFFDGIRFDRYDRPIEYRFDKRDLGQLSHNAGFFVGEPKPTDYEYVSANRVCHLFHDDFAEQRRGFTQFASGTLPAVLARKTAWSITKAMRNLAMLFGFIEQETLPAGATVKGGDGKLKPCPTERHKPGEEFKIRDGLIKALCGGAKFKSTEQKLPANGSENFLNIMMSWASQSICRPLFAMVGDFSKTNFTSGRMGMQGWDSFRDDARDRVETELYDKSLALFHAVAPRIEGFFSDELLQVLATADADPYPPEPSHKWHWPARGAISPLIEARGNQVDILIGAKTTAEISTDADVETKWRCEAKLLGLTIEQYRRVMICARYSIDAEKLAQILALDQQLTENADAEFDDDFSAIEIDDKMELIEI